MATGDLPKSVGTIESDPVRGTADPHSVAQPGDVTAAGFNDAFDLMKSVSGGIAAESLDAKNRASTAAASGSDGAVEVQQIRVADTGDPVADDALNTIWALEDGVQQNTGSHRAALNLELAQNLEQTTNNFPWLKPRLTQQLSRFKQNDPDIMLLDMFEKDQAQANKMNIDEIDRIKDYAENKLGMSPLGFGTSKWGREFSRRNTDVQLKVTNDQILAAQESNQDLDISSYLSTYKDSQTGRASSTTATFNQYREGLATFHLAMQDVTVPGAKETVSLWNNGKKQLLANEVRQNIFDDQTAFLNIPSRFWDQDKYIKAKAAHETHVGMLQDLITGIETDTPSLTQGYELYATAQAIGFEQENREVVEMARNAKAYVSMIEFGLQTFDGRGRETQHGLGVIANRLVTAMLGEDIAMSSGIPKTARDPVALRAEYSSMIQGTTDILGRGATSREERQKAYIEDVIQKNTSEYLALAGDDELSPERADIQITARGMEVVAINQSGPLDVSGQQILLESFANPNILKMTSLIDERNPAATQVLADDLMIIQENYEVDRVNRYIDNLNSTPMNFGPFAVLQNKFLTANFSDIENGNVSFTVDEKAAWQHVRETEPSIGWTDIKVMNERMVINARDLGLKVSKDLKWLAHVEAMHNGTNVADYERQYDLSFGQMRMPREEDGQNSGT